MQTPSRSPEAIQAQIVAFKAALPEHADGPLDGDFAAKLEWDSWKQHLDELESELALAQQAQTKPYSSTPTSSRGAFTLSLQITDPFIIQMLETQAKDSGVGLEHFASIVFHDALEQLWVVNNKAKPSPSAELLPALARI